MNHHTCAAGRRRVLAERRRPLAERGRTAALITMAGMLMLVTGCGGAASSPGSPGQASPSSTPGGHKSSSAPDPSAEPLASGPRSATTGGALFGGNAALVPEEAHLGRGLAIIRVYYQIGQPFPGAQTGQFMANGSTLLASLGTGGKSYATVASGRYDADIRAFLRAVDDAALQYHLGAIYISFQHEPDGPQHASLGSPAQFVQAWDHVHKLAEAAHLDWNQGGRLHWVWILLHSSFRNHLAWRYWPGPGEVDVVGADGYNSYACRIAKYGGVVSHTKNDAVTPAWVFGPAIAFARAHSGLPVFIPEWGADLSPAGAQPQFIREMQAFVAQNREIGAVMYWDSNHQCNYSIDGSPPSIAALAGMGQSAALQGRVMAPAN